MVCPGGNGDPLKVLAQGSDMIRTVIQRKMSQKGMRSIGEGGCGI